MATFDIDPNNNPGGDQALESLKGDPTLSSLADKAGNNVDEARSAVISITEAYAKMTAEERVRLLTAARAEIKRTGVTDKNGFDANVFIFQVIVKAEEAKDGNPVDDFKNFSTYNAGPGKFHPDGLNGWRTRGVAFGEAAGKLTEIASAGGEIKIPTLESLGGGKGKGGKGGKDGKDGVTVGSGATGTETEAERLAREAAEKEAADAKAKADAAERAKIASTKKFVEENKIDITQDNYLDTRAGKGTSTNLGFSKAQLQVIEKEVRDHFVDTATGQLNPVTKDKKYKVSNAPENSDKADINDKILSHTKEFPSALRGSLEQLNYQKVEAKTQIINPAATEPLEKFAKAADDKLSAAAEKVKEHLKTNKVDVSKLEGTTKIDGREYSNGVDGIDRTYKSPYFLEGYVKPLDDLITKEKAEIAEKYAQMKQLVKIGYPEVNTQGRDTSQGAGRKYDPVTGTYTVVDQATKEESKVVSEVPFSLDKANKRALQALKLMDEKEAYTTLELKKPDGTVETVRADEALKSVENQKKYADAIGAKITEALLLEEKLKNTTRKPGYNSANAEVKVLEAFETAQKTPSEQVKDLAMIENKAYGQSIAGIYSNFQDYENVQKEAWSNLRGSGSTQRISEGLLGLGGDNKKLKKKEDAIADKIEDRLKVIEKDLKTADADIAKLNGQNAPKGKEGEAVAEPQDPAKQELIDKQIEAIEAKKASLTEEQKVLQEFPKGKDLAIRGKVDLIVVKAGDQVLQVVDFTTDAEIEYKKALEEKQAKAAEEAKAATPETKAPAVEAEAPAEKKLSRKERKKLEREAKEAKTGEVAPATPAAVQPASSGPSAVAFDSSSLEGMQNIATVAAFEKAAEDFIKSGGKDRNALGIISAVSDLNAFDSAENTPLDKKLAEIQKKLESNGVASADISNGGSLTVTPARPKEERQR